MLDAEYRFEVLTKELVAFNDDRLYPDDSWYHYTDSGPYNYMEFTENGNSFRITLYSCQCEILAGKDVVYTFPTAEIYDILIGGKYVMVLYEGEDLYYLYDIGTLKVTELRGNKAVRQSVGLEEYLSGSENGVTLDPKLNSTLTVEEAANVFYVAMRWQDRDTMRRFGYGVAYFYRSEKFANYRINMFIYEHSANPQYFSVYFHGEKSGMVGYFGGPYWVELSESFYFSIKWTGESWEIDQFPGW